MYQFTAPIPNTHNAIVRPVIYKLLNDLMCEKMLPKIKRIEYNDAIRVAKLNGTVLCNKAARMKCEEFITIGAQTEYRTDDDQWIRSWSRHRAPVWADKAHELYVTPLYDEMKVTLTIQIVTTSLSMLRQWRDQVRMMQRRGRERVNHKIEYAMPFPRMAYEWFCDMYNLTDDHESMAEMIQQHASNGLDIISAGTHYEVVIAEHQINAKGSMTATTPTLEKLVNGSYSGTLEYVLEYNKPISMLFEYPIMVHQKTVPEVYLPIPDKIPNKYWVESPMDSGAVIDQDVRPVETLHVPNFDREKLTDFPPYYSPILTVLTQIDPENPLELFNLNQLGEVYLQPDILDVIQKFYLLEITAFRRCPFLLTIHRGDALMHSNYLSLNYDMDVSLTRPVSEDGIYRVSLCVLTNTSALPQSAYRGLATNREALTNYVRVVNSTPIIGRHNLGSKSHGINPKVIESDFDGGVYLHSWSPLICIKRDDPDTDDPRPWNYVSEHTYARGTAGGHVRRKTVETLNIASGERARTWFDEATGKRVLEVKRKPRPREIIPKEQYTDPLPDTIARPKPNGDDY